MLNMNDELSSLRFFKNLIRRIEKLKNEENSKNIKYFTVLIYLVFS